MLVGRKMIGLVLGCYIDYWSWYRPSTGGFRFAQLWRWCSYYPRRTLGLNGFEALRDVVLVDSSAVALRASGRNDSAGGDLRFWRI